MRADIGRLLAGQDVMARVPAAAATIPVGANDATVLTASPTTVLSADTGTQSGVATRALEPVRKRNLTPLWATLIALAVIAAGVGIFLLLNPANQVQMVTVPSLLDRTAPEANQMLKDLELVPRQVEIQGNDDLTVGRVISQQVAAETSVPVGTVVEYEVNVGPEKELIPTGLIGTNYEEAVKQLTDLGFLNVTSEVDPNEPLTARADEVTAVTPAEGATVTLNTPIVVHYATGESPVPNFTGLDQESAEDAANEAGFTKVVFVTEPSDATEGTVISQEPGRGQVVPRTTTIRLTLAGPMPVTPSPTPTPTQTPSPSPTPTTSEEPDGEPTG
jgi:serine/threonine-protein kinase